jgi:hypothetical protein
MGYRVVFDVSTAGYKAWNFALVGLVFSLAGLGVVALRDKLGGWWTAHPTASKVFAFSFLGFALLWTTVSFVTTYSDYHTLLSAERTNRLHIVEGVVSNFNPMPATGHTMERFCVGSDCFTYSDFVVTAGFNNTTSHGGPIRNGLAVRVSHLGNQIAKLEVADR